MVGQEGQVEGGAADRCGEHGRLQGHRALNMVRDIFLQQVIFLLEPPFRSIRTDDKIVFWDFM